MAALPGALPPGWMPLLHDLVTTEAASEQAHSERTAELVAQFRSGSGGGGSGAAPTPIIRLVEALGPFLMSENDGQRARAIGVLAEVVEAVPASADTTAEVSHLAHFFTSRLTDWPAVRGALRGCLALVSRRDTPQPATSLSSSQPSSARTGQSPRQSPGQPLLPAPGEGEVAGIMRSCVSNVFIRALAQVDRTLALRLLAEAVRRYGTALLAANLDLLDYMIASVDGEKDPRCLLLCFDAVQRLLHLYHAQPQDSLCHERLEESAEELFEVLACYFPVTFTPPPGDPNRITREDLAAGLESTLAAEPLFAPFLLPLALEKLSSTLRQAKMDSLSLLAACAASYGPEPLSSHVGSLWAALRAELAAPAAEGLLAADSMAADETAAAAAACLARCVAAFQGEAADASLAPAPAPAGSASLAGAVLADASMQDMLACIRSPGAEPAKHRRSTLRARAGARAAQALCRAGGAAAAAALAQLLPSLLTVGEQLASGQASAASWQSQCLAWAAVLDLLQAAAEAPAAAGAGADAALLQRAVSAAAAALAAAASEQSVGMEEEGAGEDEEAQGLADRWPLSPEQCTRAHATALQLATLASIFGAPHLAAAVQPAQVQAAVGCVLQLLTVPGNQQQQKQQAAVAPLVALASSSLSAVLAEGALPQLIAAAGRQHSAAAALAALQALAAASSGLQLHILAALDSALQCQLAASAAAQAGDGASAEQQQLLLLQLLQAATAVVSAAPPMQGATPAGAAGAAGAAAAAAAEDPAAASFQLGRHMFESAMQLPGPAADAASADVQAACGELAYHSMRTAAAPEQRALAAAAMGALQQAQQLGGMQACAACALLVPLQPEVMASLSSGGQLAGLVQLLIRLALAQPEEGGPVGRWASLAAAALLNKWPGDADSLSACISAALHHTLYPACGLDPPGTASSAGTTAPPAASPAAWACLAAVSQGLAMRGHREAEAAVGYTLRSLEAAAQRWQQEEEGVNTNSLAGGVQAAARFLGALLEEGGGGGSGSSGSRTGLRKQSYATARPLWQQRLYTSTSVQLLPLLQRSLEQAGRAGSEAQPRPAAGEEPRPALASPPLLLALGHLLQSAPSAVLQQHQAGVLPWLLQCLAALQGGPLADGELLQALLLLLSGALMSEAGRRQAESELLPRLVPALLGLARHRPSAAVRETALQCLMLLLDLPYASLHPYRRQVAAGLAAAVDDNRRTVRLQASRCRQAWSAS